MKRTLILLSVFFAMSAVADEYSEYKAENLDEYELARAISLDIRGKVLDRSELEDITISGQIDTSLIDSWMEEESFEEQIITHHKSMFWNNVSFELNPRTIFRNYGRFSSRAEFNYEIMYVYYRSQGASKLPSICLSVGSRRVQTVQVLDTFSQYCPARRECYILYRQGAAS